MNDVARTSTVLAIATLLVATRGHSEVRGDRFVSDTWKVSLRIPRLWLATDQNAYPSILLWMVRHNPRAKLLFSAEEIVPATTSHEYAIASRQRIVELGFATREPQPHGATGAYWIDFDDGRSFLRQAVLAHNGIGYALTLSTASAEVRNQMARTFDSTLRSIRSESPATLERSAASSDVRDGGLPSDEDNNGPAPSLPP